MGASAEVSQIKVWHDGKADWKYYKHISNAEGFDYNYDPEADTTNVQPDFATPPTIPAYVPASYIGYEYAGGRIKVDMNPDQNPLIDSTTTLPNISWPERNNKVWVYQWDSRQTEILANSYNNTITVSPVVFPVYADENIFYEFFRVSDSGTSEHIKLRPDLMDAVPDNKVTVAGLPDAATYKQGKIYVDTNAIPTGGDEYAVFKIVARDLNLDLDMEAMDYSLKQTLPEYYLRIRVSK